MGPTLCPGIIVRGCSARSDELEGDPFGSEQAAIRPSNTMLPTRTNVLCCMPKSTRWPDAGKCRRTVPESFEDDVDNLVQRIAQTSPCRYEMNLASAKATVAANPPTRTVCSALFTLETPVNLPFTKPKIPKAISVTTTEI